MTEAKIADTNGAQLARETDTAEWFGRVKALVASGTVVRFAPLGYSMWPALAPGRDTVSLGPAESLSRGDIVLASCSSPAIVVLHRVRELTLEGPVLMGDANLYQTELCGYSDIAGKVIAVESVKSRRKGAMRRRLSAAVQKLPPMPRRLAVRIFNLCR